MLLLWHRCEAPLFLRVQYIVTNLEETRKRCNASFNEEWTGVRQTIPYVGDTRLKNTRKLIKEKQKQVRSN